MNAIIKKALLTALALTLASTAAFARDGYEQVTESETSCNIDDGYQRVEFPNKSIYEGFFKDCTPLAGKASFYYQDVTINGYAKPLGNDTVLLTSSSGDMAVTVQMVTTTVSR